MHALAVAVQFLGLRGILAIVAVLAVLGAAWWLYTAGGDAREAEIAEDNDRAEETGETAVRDVLECYAQPGRRWDQATGRCVAGGH